LALIIFDQEALNGSRGGFVRRSALGLDFALDHRRVHTVDTFGPKLLFEGLEGGFGFGEDEKTGGFFIKPVDDPDLGAATLGFVAGVDLEFAEDGIKIVAGDGGC